MVYNQTRVLIWLLIGPLIHYSLLTFEFEFHLISVIVPFVFIVLSSDVSE